MSQGKHIAIIDYGMGNVGSIKNMLRRVGAAALIVSEPDDMRNAEKIILPGVGAFDKGMRRLEVSGFRDALERAVLEQGVPILGICLGMQLFTRGSEEGDLPGLAWIDAETVRFDKSLLSAGQRIPHMGWDTVAVRKPSPLFDGWVGEPRFYFLHSYHVVCNRKEDVLTETDCGYPFVSSFLRKHIIGAQFHPEKSHRFGMEFFRRFVKGF